MAEYTGRLGDWMAEILQNAADAGEFDNLPGKGKPLDLRDPDPYGGLEADAYRILKNAGFAPEWIELRPKIAAGVAWLREHPQHTMRGTRLSEVNEMIRKHNRLLPNPALAYPIVPLDFGRTT